MNDTEEQLNDEYDCELNTYQAPIKRDPDAEHLRIWKQEQHDIRYVYFILGAIFGEVLMFIGCIARRLFEQ